ncbi:DUF1523 family protein [Candidatus Woesearchaeota archaeon]|nr:DUF1523 family protein [Candidatus Woesearchaeota archaeon]
MTLLQKIVGIGVGLGFLALGNSYFIPDSVVTRVIETQVKRYDDYDKYLVFTDAEVFENTDAWYRLKFRTSNLQAELMKLKGKCVEIDKYGWRIPAFSVYENIVGVKGVPDSKCPK